MKRTLKFIAKEKRPCRSDEKFVAYVLGDMSPKMRADLEAHARTCPECRMRMTSFLSSGAVLDRMFTKAPRRSDVESAEKLLHAVLAQLPETRLYYDTARFSGFGSILTAATEKGICFLSFRSDAESEYVDQWSSADFSVTRSKQAMTDAMRQLQEYFKGSRTQFDLPLDLSFASEFTRKVLSETRKVGYGKVNTYLDIARRMKKPTAARAVGNALGRNPIPIIIPCHRIIASGGALGGFTGGLTVKRKLLAVEGIEIEGGDLFA